MYRLWTCIDASVLQPFLRTFPLTGSQHYGILTLPPVVLCDGVTALKQGTTPVIQDGDVSLSGLASWYVFFRDRQMVFVCDNHIGCYEAVGLYRSAYESCGRVFPGCHLIHIDAHEDNVSYTDTEPYSLTRGSIADYRDAMRRLWWVVSEQVFVSSADFDIPMRSVDDLIVCANIDIDIFAPEMSHVSYARRFALARQAIAQADFVCFATSPWFMDQQKAIEKIQQLLE